MSRSLPAGHLCTIDVLMLTIAAFASYALRLERLDLGEHWRSFVLFAGIASVVVLMLFGMTRVYAQYWRYASFHEFSLLAWTLVCVGIIIILGYGENSVFAIHNELYRWSNTPRGESGVDGDGQCRSNCTPTLHTVIADIRFAERIHAVFEWYRPEIVFHAAAHKHVPLMEANPVEAATNNVLGTRNLLDAAIVTGVERFVMISTDKAVNPTSITSGSSKRAAELLVHHAAKVSSAFRQRPGQSRQCRVDVQTADCRRWTGDSNPSGDAPLFHDHPRSGATGVAGGGAWSGRRGVYAGHG